MDISEELNLRRSSCPDDGWDIWQRERRTRRERGNTLICILDPFAGSREETSPSDFGRDLWTRRSAVMDGWTLPAVPDH